MDRNRSRITVVLSFFFSNLIRRDVFLLMLDFDKLMRNHRKGESWYGSSEVPWLPLLIPGCYRWMWTV